MVDEAREQRDAPEQASEGPDGQRPPRRRFGPRPGGDGPGGEDRGGPRGRRPGGGGGRFSQRRRGDQFVSDNILPDYKDVTRLRRYINDRAKIEPRRKTGITAKTQRRLAVAIKRARHLALLPFVSGQGNR